jgi:hypothetical protein
MTRAIGRDQTCRWASIVWGGNGTATCGMRSTRKCQPLVVRYPFLPLTMKFVIDVKNDPACASSCNSASH